MNKFFVIFVVVALFSTMSLLLATERPADYVGNVLGVSALVALIACATSLIATLTGLLLAGSGFAMKSVLSGEFTGGGLAIIGFIVFILVAPVPLLALVYTQMVGWATITWGWAWALGFVVNVISLTGKATITINSSE